MLTDKLEKITAALDIACQEKKELIRFTASEKLTIGEGYQIQEKLVARQVSRGARIVGLKMGMTSRAKLLQMKLDSPIYGVLTDQMQVQSGGEISLAPFIHPRVEPEIAFLVSKSLKGNPTIEEAIDACEGVCAALEIIDSRYKDFAFEMPDVVADNCSAAAFVLGPITKKPKFAIDNLGIILEVNGSPVQFGSSAAILGNPVLSLVELVRLLDSQGKTLPGGSIVLAGAATAAVPLESGATVRVTIEGLGIAEVKAK